MYDFEEMIRVLKRGAFFSVCRKVVLLQVHIGWRMERFGRHKRIVWFCIGSHSICR